MKKSLKHFVLFLCLIGLAACNGKENEVDSDFEYYPLKLNAPLIYQVTETRYTAAAEHPVISSWQEKDEGVRRSETQEGFPEFIFARSRRNTASEAWVKISEYSVVRYPEKYVRFSGSAATVPLFFPISPAISWDLNMFNNREKEDCRYEQIGERLSLGEKEFSRTIRVTGRDLTDDPIVRYNLGYSQYAYGIGLVYDQQTDFEYCQEEDCFGQQKISSGVSTIRQLIEY